MSCFSGGLAIIIIPHYSNEFEKLVKIKASSIDSLKDKIPNSAMVDPSLFDRIKQVTL